MHMHYDFGRSDTVHHRRGCQVGQERKITAHYAMSCSRGVDIKKYWIAPADINQWVIVLLAMTADHICSAGEDYVDVTLRHVVNGEIEYVLVNGMYETIIRRADGG